MPAYRMTYPYGRHFPTLGETLAPGEVITAEENPDGNFFEEVTVPPKSGRGSGLKAWREYAESVSVNLEDDATVTEIQDAIVAAGFPIEAAEPELKTDPDPQDPDKGSEGASDESNPDKTTEV